MQKIFSQNRQKRRLHLQSGPHRNSGRYYGRMPQIIVINEHSHKVIFHKPKSIYR
jgi:hypothetical protein